jgi:hypothetical protein
MIKKYRLNWTWRSLSAECGIEESALKLTLRRFQKEIGGEIAFREKEKTRANLKVTPRHVEAIGHFVEQAVGRRITIEDIRNHFSHFAELAEVSSFTVRKIMKARLGQTFKKVEKVNKVSEKPDNIRKFFESAYIQVIVPKYKELGVEKIWVFVKEIDSLYAYFPSLTDKQLPEREVLWNVLASIKPEETATLIKEAREHRSVSSAEETELIEIAPEFLAELEGIVCQKSKASYDVN